MSSRRQDAGTEVTDDMAQIRAEIAETRSDLGDTVEELAAKADVKQRAREAAEAAKARAGEKVSTGVQGARQRAAALAAQVRPERVRQVARQAGTQVRQRPVPYAVGVGALLLTIVVVMRRGLNR
jgi:hypothetical protein